MGIKRTLLVIEDNALNREILCSILEDRYHIIQAADGLEGLEKLREYYRELSLILLDVHMPRMNGYDFLRTVQHDAVLSAIPVIVTTGENTEQDEEACLSLGAADFITKPYNMNIALRRIQSVIRLRESDATLNAIEYDELTGLYTKRSFYHHAEIMLQNNPTQGFDIVISDIENFQRINELYGNVTGNDIIRYMGRGLEKIPSELTVCGRYGADQFAVLFPHKDDVFLVMILDKIEERMKAYAKVKNLTLKFGVYENVEHHIPVSQLCDRIITAIRTIKHQYGARIVKYDEKIKKRVELEFQIEVGMQRALEEHQFQVYYQPKHSLKTEAVCGAEALVRWIHPELGFMSPGDFIPLFEKNGFIRKLDEYVLYEVCKNINRWKEMGIPVVPISINLSRRDFETPNLAEKITEIVDHYDIAHSMIHLEITESSYTDDPETVCHIVNQLHEEGFIIELDDFGTGYSSLTSLNNMSIDILKLDMSIIHNDVPGMERSVLEFAMMLAKMMKLETVQEGVEKAEQVERVRALGCDYVQGYYFSAPLPLEKFEAYLCENMQE